MHKIEDLHGAVPQNKGIDEPLQLAPGPVRAETQTGRPIPWNEGKHGVAGDWVPFEVWGTVDVSQF